MGFYAGFYDDVDLRLIRIRAVFIFVSFHQCVTDLKTTKHLSPQILNHRRLEAVRLRLDGHTVADTAARTGLSAPTVSAAWKAFRAGGWEAVPVRTRGRKAGQTTRLDTSAQQALVVCLAAPPPGDLPAWSSRALAEALKAEDHDVSPRAIDHWLEARDLKPAPLGFEALERRRGQASRWYRQQVMPVIKAVHQAGGSLWQGGIRVTKPGHGHQAAPRHYQLYLHGKRGTLYSQLLTAPPRVDDYLVLFQRLLARAAGKPIALVFHGAYFRAAPEIQDWLNAHPALHLMPIPTELRAQRPTRHHLPMSSLHDSHRPMT